MLLNYLKIAIRNLVKHKLFSFINVLGLAIGITCSILIILFVNFERSYDRYNEKANRIYRVAVTALIGNTKINQTYSSAVTFAKLLEDFPEIETGVKMTKFGQVPININNKIYNESNIYAVDSTFFDVFTFSMIHGNSKISLTDPHTIVLTENTAVKYFGTTDIVGKTITLHDDDNDTNIDFKVTGVCKNVPENSHFHFNMLVSLTSFPEMINNKGWTANNFVSYIVLKKGVSKNDLTAKLKDFTRKYMGGEKFDAWVAKGNYWTYFLQPVTGIHLDSELNGEFEQNGSRSYVNIFSLVSIIVLLIACINFMNLSTAKSSMRAREVGLRKVVGSNRNKLIFQFLFESVLLTFIALVIALAFLEILLPFYRNFVNKPLEINYLNDISVISFLILFGLIVGVISGFYPAFILSSFKPIAVLKNNAVQKSRGFNFRNILVIVQFAISIFLIIGTAVIYKQLSFIQNKNLGFKKEQVLVIKNPGAITGNISAFKNSLSSYNNIIEVSGSSSLPGTQFNNIGFGAEGNDDIFTLNLCICDYNFQNALRLDMLQGRFFSKEFPSDSTAIILNQKAAELLGWKNPIGKIIHSLGNHQTDFQVIGVVKDFNYESLHTPIRPMGLFDINGFYSRNQSYISIRLKTGNLVATVGFIESKWREFASGAPFEYSFLDEDFNNLYKNEKQTEQLFIIFAFLAIFIACLGLFGLSSYVAELRRKEIGVRKVLGASVGRIIFSLSKEFMKWIVLANIIAWPVAYYFMNNWLQNFAYRINISWWIFVLSGCIALLIAIVTVSFQAIKAAAANLVKSLRYE
jgi:putative ABC transport system permease protein